MKRTLTILICLVLLVTPLSLNVSAATTHTVARGDTMWRIAKTYQVGLDELARANPHIANPALIYPGQVLTIPSVGASVLSFEKRVVELVNAERASRRLSALTYDWELSRVARYKSQDMKDKGYFSHQSPTYGSPFQMMKSFGISYKSAGENIAKGYTSPEAVVNGWMNSSGHRANILNASYTHIGVGYVASGHYWTQMFIRK